MPRIIIQENELLGCSVDMLDVRDIPHARRLLIQSLLAVENEGKEGYAIPADKLYLLRGILSEMGAADKETARRLLLLTISLVEDESDERRFVVPRPLIPIVLRR